MKDTVTMSRGELQRRQVLEQASRGLLSLSAATAILKVCYRHAKRLLARYRRDGPKGMAHRHRGQAALKTQASLNYWTSS